MSLEIIDKNTIVFFDVEYTAKKSTSSCNGCDLGGLEDEIKAYLSPKIIGEEIEEIDFYAVCKLGICYRHPDHETVIFKEVIK